MNAGEYHVEADEAGGVCWSSSNDDDSSSSDDDCWDYD
jgi:hypothetical protein